MMRQTIRLMQMLLFLIGSIIGSGLRLHAIAGISLAGTSGMINIPTAEVITDQQITIVMGYINRHSAYLERGHCDNFPFYIVLGYLPRLEFSVGVTFVPGQKSYDGTDTYKDGIVSLQYLLLKETKFLPAVVVGTRDIYSFILLNTTFFVGSKTIFQQLNTKLQFHLGYGSDLIDRHLGVPKKDRKFPVGHTIVGVYGGLEISWKEAIHYMLEYDSQKFNTGFRFRLNPHFNFDLHFLNMKDLSGSFNLSFDL
ncbi:MAG: YjbH domain-containing protein [bacterium]|nr:MAG: YjbH domain-containing protein [bacterium]